MPEIVIVPAVLIVKLLRRVPAEGGWLQVPVPAKSNKVVPEQSPPPVFVRLPVMLMILPFRTHPLVWDVKLVTVKLLGTVVVPPLAVTAPDGLNVKAPEKLKVPV